jgi:hypothetical protein
MREMAKSMFRFSWAMSVFGVEQLRKLVSDEYADRREDEIKSGFDSLSESAGLQFSKQSRSLYEAGDKLQQESVDMLFDFSRPSNWKAEKIVDKAADLVDRSAEALRDLAHDKPKEETSAEASPEVSKAKKAGNDGA